MEEKPICVLQVTLLKIQIIRQNFQILEGIPQTFNTNHFHYCGLLFFFLLLITNTNHLLLRGKQPKVGRKQKVALLNRSLSRQLRALIAAQCKQHTV